MCVISQGKINFAIKKLNSRRGKKTRYITTKKHKICSVASKFTTGKHCYEQMFSGYISVFNLYIVICANGAFKP